MIGGLNPNRLQVRDVQSLLGVTVERARAVVAGAPYYSMAELAQSSGLPPSTLDQLFWLPPLVFRDKADGRRVAFTAIPDRYVVSGDAKPNDARSVTDAGFVTRRVARGPVALRVVGPGVPGRPPLPHVLKAQLPGRIHPVLMDRDGHERIVVPGHVDIWFHRSIPPTRCREVLGGLGVEVLDHRARVGYYRTRLSRPADGGDTLRAVLNTIERANTHNEVRFAESEEIGFEDFAPDDAGATATATTSDGSATFWSDEAISLPVAHKYATGAGVTVIIIDSFERAELEMLSAALPDWVPSDAQSDFALDEPQEPTDRAYCGAHGARVASIVRRVAPRATILPMRISGHSGAASPGYGLRAAAMIAALDTIPRGTRIVMNLSWRTAGEHIGVREALVEASWRNVVVTASAGNYAADESQHADDPQYPSGHAWRGPRLTNLLSVAAVGPGDERAPYSHFGTSSVTISAPGGVHGGHGYGVYTACAPGEYAYVHGTSFAAPYVAGVAALVLQTAPAMSAAKVATLLADAADDIDESNPVFTGMLGGGRINAARAVRMARDDTR